MGYLTVRVQLHKATDLPVADINSLGGKADPYIIFSLGVHQARSSCINKNLNPEWNDANFQFQIDSNRYNTASLDVNVWDNDVWRKDDLLGTISLPLNQLPRKNAQVQAYPIDLEPEFQNQAVQSKVYMTIQLLDENEAADTLCLEVWENERYSLLSRSWRSDNLKSSDPKKWSSETGQISAARFDDAIPPYSSRYVAEDSWHYVKTCGDLDGWVYAPDFSGPWFEQAQMRFFVRRRRWVQKLKLGV